MLTKQLLAVAALAGLLVFAAAFFALFIRLRDPRVGDRIPKWRRPTRRACLIGAIGFILLAVLPLANIVGWW